jgi:hypothetical protein
MKKPVPIYVAIKSSKNPERLKRENLNRHLGKGLAVTSFFTETGTWEEKVWLHLLEKAA